MVRKKKRIKEKQDSNVFHILMFRYFPYWPLFAGLSLVMVIFAWIYLQIANPVYEATATLLIKDQKKGVEDPGMVESLNVYNFKKIVENEIEVIRSKTLMKETVRELQLASPVFEDGLFSSLPAYSTSPVVVYVKDIDEIVEAKRVEISFSEVDSLVQFDGERYPLDSWIQSPYGEISFVKNPYLLAEGIGPFYVSFVDPRKVINGLMKNLSVQPSNKLSTVINLSLKDPVPVRAENILNTLIESYNKAALSDKNSLAARTLEFVEERIVLVERELDSLERSIERYKSTRGIVDLSEQGKVFLKNVGDNDQKLSEINMQLAVLDKLEDYVVQKENSKKIVPATLALNDRGLSALVEKLYTAEIEYERLKQTTAVNNPILMSIRDEIENLRPGISDNIRNQKSALIASRSNLSVTNDKYASMLGTIPTKEKELLEATRQQAIKNNVYTFLLQKREETALVSGATEGDSRLVDKAESSIEPISPKKLSVFALAIVIGCSLSAAWVIKKEILNNTILFRSEIESNTAIPIAAEIADSDMHSHIVIDNLKKPFLTEQFSQLRASIGLFGTSNKRIVMITSAISGEGKSFVSTNFAMSLAGSNKKVLLIDMDLRNPKLSNLFRVGEAPGVAEIMLGTTPIEKVVRRTATQNLFLIGAGRNRQSATEKLLDGQLEDLFNKLSKYFHYIIVDTPPVAPVADAYIISPLCDITLFIVRHGKTPKRILELLGQNNKVMSMKNISIVFNGLRPRGFVKNGSGYGYGYGDGYSYEYSRSYP